MKNLIYFFGLIVLIFASCQSNIDNAEKNSIPYPLEEWKGIQGKTLENSKPDFVGQKKAPKGLRLQHRG